MINFLCNAVIFLCFELMLEKLLESELSSILPFHFFKILSIDYFQCTIFHWVLQCESFLYLLFYFYKIQFSCVKFWRLKFANILLFLLLFGNKKSYIVWLKALLVCWFFPSAIFVMNWIITDCSYLILR